MASKQEIAAARRKVTRMELELEEAREQLGTLEAAAAAPPPAPAAEEEEADADPDANIR